MHIWKSHKGIIHVGFGVLLLILIVAYIVISMNSPSTQAHVDTALKNLSTSAKGLIPFT